MDFDNYLSNLDNDIERLLSDTVNNGLELSDHVSSSENSFIFCPECGLRQSADSAFCCECGTALRSDYVDESYSEYNGIIMTDISKIAVKYGCDSEYIKSCLNQYIEESKRFGTNWILLDIVSQGIKCEESNWGIYSDRLDDFMASNGITPSHGLSLFIIGGHDVIPHPTSDNPSGGNDKYDSTIFSDFLYCFKEYPALDFLDFNKARCNVARLPLESGKLNSTFESDIKDYLDRTIQVLESGGISVGRAIMTSNKDWIPASREMSRNLPTPHFENVEGETLDNMFISPGVMKDMPEHLAEKYYGAIGEADMLVFNLHGACDPDDSGFYSNGLAFDIDTLRFTSAPIFNTVACWGGRYIRYERKDSMLLNAIYNGNVLLYSGACVPALGKCGSFTHDQTWRIQPAAYSETFMARYCEYQCIGKLNAGEAFLKAKCDYYNSSRMVEDDEHILSTVLMFNLYGNPALMTQPDIDALTEIQEPTGAKKIPFRKIRKDTILEKSANLPQRSLHDSIAMAVTQNLRHIHSVISERLYRELGLEPRQLSRIERYEAVDPMDFNNRGYIYSYDRQIGCVKSRIIAKTDERGNFISAVQTK